MCFALFAWFTRAALVAGIAKIATGKACNECKTLGQWGLVCYGHKCSFPNSHFLDSGLSNNKRSSDIDGKTSECLSRICLYYRYLELRFC